MSRPKNRARAAFVLFYLVAHGEMDLGAVEGSLEDARPFPEAQLLHDVRAHLICFVIQVTRTHDAFSHTAV